MGSPNGEASSSMDSKSGFMLVVQGGCDRQIGHGDTGNLGPYKIRQMSELVETRANESTIKP